MSPLAAAVVVVTLVAATTLLGMLWRSRQGRVRTTVHPALVRPSDVGVDGGFGERATLLQFSTEFCAYCPATRRVLGGLAGERDGVEHVDVDLTNAPAVAKRFNVLQTPTTLVLDGAGAIRARIGGAPRPRELAERLDQILGETHVAA
jgi:thiol-disulfide isomerase/thioredoxin